MRLIDADAYADEMRKKQNNCRVWKDSLDEGTELYARAEQALGTFVEAALTLKSQPTIDAIPVEWLRKAQDRMLNSPRYSFVECAIVGTLIKAWQREQEAR